MNTEYLPSFLKELKNLKSTPYYKTISNNETITFWRVLHRKEIYRYFPPKN